MDCATLALQVAPVSYYCLIFFYWTSSQVRLHLLSYYRNNIIIWFEIKPCYKKSFLLCFVYRKPIASYMYSELVEWIDKSESELNNAILLNSDIVLTGNFNMTFLPCKTSQKWLSILETYNLNQIQNVVPTY